MQNLTETKSFLHFKAVKNTKKPNKNIAKVPLIAL
jgi:hypothetical protein